MGGESVAAIGCDADNLSAADASHLFKIAEPSEKLDFFNLTFDDLSKLVQEKFSEPDYRATLAWIQKEYSNQLKAAERRQNNWYGILVKLADSLWARSNGNPLAISDDMRMAARELNLSQVKDWMKDFQMVEMVRCKACGSLKNPQYPICAQCHFPDPDHPMTKQLLEMRQQMPQK